MNATEMLDDSHIMIIQAVDHLPELEWEKPGASGEWTVKEILAHLTSYELALIDVLNTFFGHQPTPYMARLVNNGDEFNMEEVEKRTYTMAQHVLDEYNDAQLQAISLLAQIPPERIEQLGTMPWYGKDRCLSDVIRFFYNHTCTHCEQIVTFRNRPG
jgi:uncharacterized damage-inducible protein DinB